MSQILALNIELATLVSYPEKGIVHHTFHKPIGGDAFRSVLLTGVDLLREHGDSKWLSDDRGNGALAPEDTEWSFTAWFPQAKEAGWKFWALVVPEDMMARMNLKQIIEHYSERRVRIMVFTSLEQALPWLENIG